MSNPFIFDSEGLSLIGIAFETKEETDSFIEVLQEEVEVRIGTAFSKKMTEKQLEEFEHISGALKTTVWLQSNCPEYKTIIQTILKEMKKELLRYRERIPGICQTAALSNNSIPIEELFLSTENYKHLKQLGIDTVGEASAMRRCFDISNLEWRTLNPMEADAFLEDENIVL